MGLSALRRQQRQSRLTSERDAKDQVRLRDGYRCRICRRPMGSVHEIVPKSLGGVPSLENSIAVCGDGVSGCHGFLQRHEIDPLDDQYINANEPLWFVIRTRAAYEWATSVPDSFTPQPIKR